MYDIVTLEPEDGAVERGVNAIIKGQGTIPDPQGNYRYIVPGSHHVEGDGGTHSHVVVVVGHGTANSISKRNTFAKFREDAGDVVDWKNATTIVLVPCSTNAEDGTAFLHGNIAHEVKAACPHATVWASSTAVTRGSQSGWHADWHKL